MCVSHALTLTHESPEDDVVVEEPEFVPDHLGVEHDMLDGTRLLMRLHRVGDDYQVRPTNHLHRMSTLLPITAMGVAVTRRCTVSQ